MATIEVKIQRLPGNTDVPLPAYQSPEAVGMDLHAAVREPVTVAPGEVAGIPCGFAMALPAGYENAVSLANTPGTIDPDYRGEVKVLLINHGKEPFVVTRGMRIAQMVVMPVPRVVWSEVSELSKTVRGEGGFGHTGH